MIWKCFTYRGYIKRLVRETGEEIEELTNEIRHDIEVRHHCQFVHDFFSDYIHPFTGMSMLNASDLLTL
jgi:hypothetical protein